MCHPRVAANAALLVVLALAGCTDRSGQPVAPPRGTLIAHGLGGIAGVDYSNSREAFQLWYGRGRRWFEADLAVTADHHLVCAHSGLEPWLGLGGSASSVTLERFRAWRVAGTYTSLSLRELLELLRDRHDAFLILDPGRVTSDLIERVQADVDAVDPGLRRRLLVEFYAPEDLVVLRGSETRHGRFGALVYTTYQRIPSADDVVRLVGAENVRVVVLGTYAVSRTLVARLHAAGASVIVYTVNDPKLASGFLRDGADALMTDFLAEIPPVN